MLKTCHLSKTSIILIFLPAGPATKAVAGRKNIDKSGTKHD